LLGLRRRILELLGTTESEIQPEKTVADILGGIMSEPFRKAVAASLRKPFNLIDGTIVFLSVEEKNRLEHWWLQHPLRENHAIFEDEIRVLEICLQGVGNTCCEMRHELAELYKQARQLPQQTSDVIHAWLAENIRN